MTFFITLSSIYGPFLTLLLILMYSYSFFSARYIFSNVYSCPVFVRLLFDPQMSLDLAYQFLIVLLLHRVDVISDSVRLLERSVVFLCFLLVLLYPALHSLNQYCPTVRSLPYNQVEL